MPQFIIGRQEGTHKLQISGANGFIGAIDAVGSVDATVSRKHAKVEIDVLSGDICITNLNEYNSTFVNGVEILTKHITTADKVELGANHYLLNLEDLLEALPKTGVGAVPLDVDISPLEKVWEKYSETKRKFQISQGRLRAIQSLTMVFTLGSAVVGFLLPEGSRTLQIICYGLAVFFVVVLAIINWRGASGNINVMEQNDEYLREHYNCPNDQCQRFLGYTKYKDLLKVGRCPYCGTKFRG